jgi:23S rRNA (guanosine2251-2'-O)-methyltransferase
VAVKNFLVWGIHPVRSALTLAVEGALELWVRTGDLSTDLACIRDLADAAGVSTQRVPVKTLARLTEGAVHQGVALRRRMPPSTDLGHYLARLPSPDRTPLLLVLDQVQDPQNFGACLRVADGAGADAVLFARDHSTPLTGTVAKAASGALDSVSLIAVSNLARALDRLRDAGIWLVGMAGEASETIYDCDLGLPVGLVLGGEARGLRQLTRAKCDRLARIPMDGVVGSLNVATAAAITLFEARRQRMV